MGSGDEMATASEWAVSLRLRLRLHVHVSVACWLQMLVRHCRLAAIHLLMMLHAHRERYQQAEAEARGI